jgi:drug/metabolite transporter (DMT)-like permease
MPFKLRARATSVSEERDAERSWLRAELPLIAAVLLLGTNPVAVKVAVSEVPVLPFVALRFTAAGLLLIVLARLLGQKGPRGRELFAMAGVGVLGVGLNNVLFSWGVSLTSASDTALIYAAVPVWGMLLGLALGWERPTLGGVLGVTLAFAGVGLIVGAGAGGGDSSLKGNLLVLGATVCWGSYAVLSLPLLKRHPPLSVAAHTMLFGGLGALPLGITSILGTDWVAVSGGAWTAIAYSTFFVAAFGFAAWQGGISRAGANRILVYQYLITLVGVVSGIVLLGEGFGVNKVLGGAIVLLGVYLARRR